MLLGAEQPGDSGVSEMGAVGTRYGSLLSPDRPPWLNVMLRSMTEQAYATCQVTSTP
jgi:hypothetical protein